jgi:hypothetical protein
MGNPGRTTTGNLAATAGTMMLLVSLLLALRAPLEATLRRNLADQELVKQLDGATADCRSASLLLVSQHLEQAMRLQPQATASWTQLLRVKGLIDREWILHLQGGNQSFSTQNNYQAIDAASENLFPANWAMYSAWSTYRCMNAWGAWTLGLIEATHGHWERATAAYQAGLGLAPGRVPEEIVKEYYAVLAQHILSNEPVSSGRILPAAKYLALSGAVAEAQTLLQELRHNGQQHCDVDRWSKWLRQVENGENVLPPGPMDCDIQLHPCKGGSGQCFQAQPYWTPEWILPANDSSADYETDALHLGFDLDPDVLEAGAEILVTIYQEETNGEVSVQVLRQPNLWPNSGNSWLKLEGFSTCLPGYVQAPWMSSCSSGVLYTHADSGGTDPVGHIRVPLDEGPDTLIMTAGILIPEGKDIVYGGWWENQGDFPRAELARYGGVRSEPRFYYEVLLELSDLPGAAWQARLGTADPIPQAHEFSGWLRSRANMGAGYLKFDDVFSFVLPGQR